MKMTNKQARVSALLLALLVTLTVPAQALFGKKSEEAAAPAEGAPIAKEISVRTYRNIPYRAQFLASDDENGELTFTVDTAPKKGTVTVAGDVFTYTPTEGKSGKDSFTYVVTDPAGNVSAPATVTVMVEKTKSGVEYQDMEDNSAAAAAQYLAETGAFTGARIGGQYYFEPERTLSRAEFLAMTMELANLPADTVTMTGFSDDEAIPTWAKSYAAAGLSEGIIRGVSTETGAAFRSNEPVTFNEAAAILDRVLAVGDVDLATWYADRDATPSWAAQAVGNLEAVSVMSVGSFGSGTLAQPMTRADAAQMLCAAGTLLDGEQTGLLDWMR
ncbi:hypothetical protein SDC9_55008 [bioreactor metagenome]|uniref:SLH domain-containing protein n=2 Tax=root TaxID=1 RepID=A0A644X3I6_9ZZZZ